MRLFSSIILAVLLSVAGIGQAMAQSIEDMAGQMVLVGFQGNRTGDAGFAAVREQVATGQIGGVMYLRPNVSSLSRVRAMNAALKAARPWLQPFIAVDQEGGQIRRLTASVGFGEIDSAASIGSQGEQTARAVYADLAERLAAQGFNVNFGPVVDLNLNRSNPIIARYERSFGTEPDSVAELASAFVEGHRAAGLGTSLKHFPGHGSSTGDTHEGFVDVTEVWDEVELEPYRTLIEAGAADMIMVAHIFNARYAQNPERQLPASLSRVWIEDVLRDQLGYGGIVISDDMEMAAVRARFGLRETIMRAVMAGNDILLFSNTADYDPELGARVHEIMVEEARNDSAFAERVEQSYRRIMTLKRRLGLAR